jgi:hypothetical protein
MPTIRFRPLLALAACACVLFGCGDDEGAPDAGGDGHGGDGGATVCSPVEPPSGFEACEEDGDYAPCTDDGYAACVSDDGAYHRI